MNGEMSTEGNIKLALALGWKQLPGGGIWARPDGHLFDPLPDFEGTWEGMGLVITEMARLGWWCLDIQFRRDGAHAIFNGGQKGTYFGHAANAPQAVFGAAWTAGGGLI